MSSIFEKPSWDDQVIFDRTRKALEYTLRTVLDISNKANIQGALSPNQLADFAMLSKNYLQVANKAIKDIYSVMTVVGGDVVHANDESPPFNPAFPRFSPSWSPVQHYGTYGGSNVSAPCSG